MAIYFDNSATSKPFPEVADTVYHYMQDDYYNPSALYAPAVHVSQNLSKTREFIARDMRVSPNAIYFNSGGTEGNNAIIRGVIYSRPASAHAVTTIGEHSSVVETFRQLQDKGYNADIIGINPYGGVNIDELLDAIHPNTALVSIMQVSNETGVINDISEIARRVHRIAPRCVVHSDGVQAYPKLPFPRGVDAYTFSGHKFHAPRGIGGAYISDDIMIEPIITGGGQERGMRGGTENCAAIQGMGEALNIYYGQRQEFTNRMFSVKKRLYENLTTIDSIRLNGPSIEQGAPHILNVSFAGANSETIVNSLSEKEIYVGTGSACSSRKNSRNRVLVNMGVPGEFLGGAIRFSLCYSNTETEADVVAQEIYDAVKRIRRFRRI